MQQIATDFSKPGGTLNINYLKNHLSQYKYING